VKRKPGPPAVIASQAKQSSLSAMYLRWGRRRRWVLCGGARPPALDFFASLEMTF